MSPIPGINCQEKRLVMAQSVTVAEVVEVEATNNRLGGYNCHNIRLQRQKFYIQETDPDVSNFPTPLQLSSGEDGGF